MNLRQRIHHYSGDSLAFAQCILARYKGRQRGKIEACAKSWRASFNIAGQDVRGPRRKKAEQALQDNEVIADAISGHASASLRLRAGQEAANALLAAARAERHAETLERRKRRQFLKRLVSRQKANGKKWSRRKKHECVPGVKIRMNFESGRTQLCGQHPERLDWRALCVT